jgi:hypothetical protein
MSVYREISMWPYFDGCLLSGFRISTHAEYTSAVVTFPSCGGAFLLFLCAILVDDDSVEKNKYKIERLLSRPTLDEKTLFVISLVGKYRANRARMRSKERESLWGKFAQFGLLGRKIWRLFSKSKFSSSL